MPAPPPRSAMTTARVARITALDGPDGITISDEPVGPPGPGEVAVDVLALGLNRAEALLSRGEYLVAAELPNRVGVEGAGRVAAVGDGVEGVAVGDRVGMFFGLDMTEYGAAAERVVVPARLLLPDVPGLSDEALAAFWMAYLTAYAGLAQTGRLAPGETVVVTAASSSVGLAALDVAGRLGATAVATTRTGAKRDRLLAAGAARVVATDDGTLAEAGVEADLVFDAVAGPFAAQFGPALRPGGRAVLYGLLSGDPATPFPLFDAFVKGIEMVGFHLGLHALSDPERRADALGWLVRSHAERPFEPAIDRAFAFDDLADAYRYLEASGQVGKVLVRVGPSHDDAPGR